jgi:hypothetical protein
MKDPNMDEFYDRVAKIQRDHSKGYGMEAAGTLGRSSTRRRPSWRVPIIAPLLVILACGFALKATLHARIGEDLYNQRVATLEAGQAIDQIGAVLMRADPVTTALSAQIKKLWY